MESAPLTRDINPMIRELFSDFWLMVCFGTSPFPHIEARTINLRAFTNRHFRDRGQIWAGNDGDQMGYKLKIPGVLGGFYLCPVESDKRSEPGWI